MRRLILFVSLFADDDDDVDETLETLLHDARRRNGEVELRGFSSNTGVGSMCVGVLGKGRKFRTAGV